MRYSKEFRKFLRKIDFSTSVKVMKVLNELLMNPNKGKPLRGELKNKRSIRIEKIRVVYKIEGKEIWILYADHRKDVYEK